MLVNSFAFLVLAHLAHATPLTGRASTAKLVVHEKLDAIPSGFTSSGPASDGQTLTLRIGLAQSNPKGLEERLMAVSTPGSPDRGNFLSKAEVGFH